MTADAPPSAPDAAAEVGEGVDLPPESPLDRLRALRETFERAATLPRTIASPPWVAPLLEWMVELEKKIVGSRG